ncbi:MAG: TetR/AcrR family transcriptional regulator, partial [Oscillospiraceae bacterium]
MSDTKESILLAALKLFARDGYEAASMSSIAGELGITKGALYKHYKSKRAIFDSIVERMFREDEERSRAHAVPAHTYEEAPSEYRDITAESVREFTASQFLFWTEDAFAADFRRMLTLEQYRNGEMARLYGSIIAEGPVSYLADIFRAMTERGALAATDPVQLATEYYAPFFLLIGIYDRTGDRERCLALLNEHTARFFKMNTPEKTIPPRSFS